MMVPRFRLLCLGLSLAGVVIPATAEEPRSADAVSASVADDATDVPREEPFEHYLFRTAARLDGYFTMERIASTPGVHSAMYDLRGLPGRPETIDDWVRQLNEEAKGFRAVRNAERPRIVHLVERSLAEGKGGPLNGKGYPLDGRATGTFSGELMDLSDQVGRSVPGVATRRGFPVGGFVVTGDRVTKVEVNFKDKPVRDVLTDAVPLEGYMRELWEAETGRDERGEVRTQVLFFGPESSYDRKSKAAKTSAD